MLKKVSALSADRSDERVVPIETTPAGMEVLQPDVFEPERLGDLSQLPAEIPNMETTTTQDEAADTGASKTLPRLTRMILSKSYRIDGACHWQANCSYSDGRSTL